jgi:hypothetical protein
MTASREDLPPAPLTAVDPGLCLGTRDASTGDSYRTWGMWQRGFASVRLQGDAIRFKIHPGSVIRQIPLAAVARIEVAKPDRRLPVLRMAVLRVHWSEGEVELVTSFILGRRPDVAECWARIVEALRAGIDPELLREQLSSPGAQDAEGVARALASAGAIHAARSADHDWDPNWRSPLPLEALVPDLSRVPTSVWGWRPKPFDDR